MCLLPRRFSARGLPHMRLANKHFTRSRLPSREQRVAAADLHSPCYPRVGSPRPSRATRLRTATRPCLRLRSGARSAPRPRPRPDEQRGMLQSPPARRPWTSRTSSSPRPRKRRTDCCRPRAARAHGPTRRNRSRRCSWPRRRRPALPTALQRATAVLLRGRVLSTAEVWLLYMIT